MTRQNAHRALATLVLGVVVVLHVARAAAEVAGTGTFDFTGHGFPPNVTFDGDITFDDAIFNVGGVDVNLGTSVGMMTYSGSAVVNTPQLRATFDLTADDPNSDFAFTGSGSGACQNACLGGSATFAGQLTSVTDPGGVLPDPFRYTFDGTIAINFLGMGPGGTVAINVFAPMATPTGMNVMVESGPTTFFDTRAEQNRTFDIDLVFAQVTVVGDTTFVGLTAVPGNIPAGIALDPAVSRFVDIITSAQFSGMVKICANYADANMDGIIDGTPIPVALLRLLHATAAGQPFVDVTTMADNGQVCGMVSSLSPTVVGVASPATTTTTTVPGNTATTTTTTTPSQGGCTDAVACVNLALGTPLCGSEQINPKLAKVIATKLGKARTLLQKSATASAAKTAKLVKKARKQLDVVRKKVDAFVSKKKGPISPACRDSIRATLDQIGQAITDSPRAGG